MAKATRIHLLLIDPQFDFTDPSGALFVPGAEKDAPRVAKLIDRLAKHLDDIHVTVDSHQEMDISHPMWFKDPGGMHPTPFTLIPPEDMESGKWTTTLPGCFKRTLEYTKALKAGNRFVHTIWPEHCLIGTRGHAIQSDIRKALADWCRMHYCQVDYVTKGSNPWTEHFSGVKAEVPDPADPSTQVNTRLISTLGSEADIILIAGEAGTHCVRFTLEDIVTEFANPDYVKKMVVLEDAMSYVPDPPPFPGLFSKPANDFYARMKSMGVTFTTTDKFLSQ